MASLDSIDKLLGEAGSLLDQATCEIRDAPLRPTRDNIRRIAKALAEIFEIQYLIYALKPELTPSHLKGPSENPELTLNMTLRRAAALEHADEIDSAIAILELFIANESSESHRDRARAEIARLRGG